MAQGGKMVVSPTTRLRELSILDLGCRYGGVLSASNFNLNVTSITPDESHPIFIEEFADFLRQK
jgi:hypothetical protein